MPKPITAFKARDEFLEYMQVLRNASPHTVEAYGTDLTRFLEFMTQHLGNEPTYADLERLELRDFRAWLAWLANRKASNVTRARHLASVRSFYRYLVMSYDMPNTMVNALRPPRRPPPFPRTLTQDHAIGVARQIGEVSRTKTLGARDTALFTLLYGAGLRIAEALALNVRDVPRRGEDASVRVTGKGSKQRIVPLIDAVQVALADWLAVHPSPQPENPLFVGARGKRLDPAVAQRTLRIYRRLNGLPEHATPHALRHSFASHLLSAGVDLRSIQLLLGHSSLVSTERYTSVDEARLMHVWSTYHPRANIEITIPDFDSPEK
jgi:integrase/recombinase XerC